MNRKNSFSFFEIFDSILSTSMLNESREISQNTTLPPRCSTTFAVEIHVKAGTIASSPGPKSKNQEI